MARLCSFLLGRNQLKKALILACNLDTTVCDIAWRWFNGDAAFKPGQTHACALVNAQAKSQVAVILALQLQLVGQVKLGRVAVVLTPTEN